MKSGKKLLIFNQFMVMEFLLDPISLIFSQSSDIGSLLVQSSRHKTKDKGVTSDFIDDGCGILKPIVCDKY